MDGLGPVLVLVFPKKAKRLDWTGLSNTNRESIGRKTETEVLGGGGMELIFLWLGKEIVFAKALEDFMDVLLMRLEVLEVY